MRHSITGDFAGRAQTDPLLFVAHRDEILLQSQQVFQLVLRQPEFGERLVGGERPVFGRHVFASVQSLAHRIEDIEPDAFEVVIVDEFHHAAAASYERLLTRLRPRYLLGLTATPERADGKSVLDWLTGESHRSLACGTRSTRVALPVSLFGVNDTANLSAVRFERGRYVLGELDQVLTGDHVRALRVRHAVEQYLSEPHRMRALDSARASVTHTSWQENSPGSTIRRWHWMPPPHAMTAARRSVASAGEIRVIFTVDLSTKASTC